MWYYADSKKKIGPLSEVAVLKLREDGKISDSTLVWSPKQKVWKKYSESGISSRNDDSGNSAEYLSSIRRKTAYFRALLISLCIFSGAKIWYTYQNILAYVEYINGELGMTEVQHSLLRAESKMTYSLLSLMLYGLIFFTMLAAYKWTYTAAVNSKIVDRRFSLSPTVAGFSYIIPFINFILPGKVIWKIFGASQHALGRTPGIVEVAYTGTWWTLWIITLCVIAVRIYGFSDIGHLDKNVALFCFSIYVDTVILASSFVFILIISRVRAIQVKFFSSRRARTRHTIFVKD